MLNSFYWNILFVFHYGFDLFLVDFFYKGDGDQHGAHFCDGIGEPHVGKDAGFRKEIGQRYDENQLANQVDDHAEDAVSQ